MELVLLAEGCANLRTLVVKQLPAASRHHEPDPMVPAVNFWTKSPENRTGSCEPQELASRISH
jgi:hypothetical protein